MTTKRYNVGDRVTFYCYSRCINRVGTVTAVDVDVLWKGSYGKHPKGVQIDGSITKPYDDLLLTNAAQDRHQAAERELGEARAERDQARQHLRVAGQSLSTIASHVNEATAWVGDRVKP